MIEIYTDGGCRNNPGQGAWAYVIVKDGDILRKCSEYAANTTNNLMELTAIYKALRYISDETLMCNEEVIMRNEEVVLYSDSQYAVNAINVWYRQWLDNGKLNKKKHTNLIGYIMTLKSRLNLKIEWTKAHSTNPFNNLADRLVNEAMDNLK